MRLVASRQEASVALRNAEIARMLDELAELLEIAGENPFRVRAYRNAARTVESHARRMADLVAEGADLAELPGIGEAIAAKIATIVRTGALPQLEAARRRVPPVLVALTRVRGLGPSRIRALHETLRVEGPEDLRRAIRDGRVRALPGFGDKTARLVEEGLARLDATERRVPLLEAEEIAEPLVAWLRALAGVGEATVAGSYRRRRATVGDLDVLVTCRAGTPVADRLAGYEATARLRRQMAAIDRLNERLDGIVVLKGCEVDILADGSLDLPDGVLAELDLVVGAVHSDFDLPRARQTERLLRAMDHPHFTILAHPTGRLVDQRPPIDVDVERIVAGARERSCFLELNAQPSRLDLSDAHCRLARAAGVAVAVSTDAHRETHLDYMRLGIDQARRGWLARGDVLNTLPLARLRRRLRR